MLFGGMLQQFPPKVRNAMGCEFRIAGRASGQPRVMFEKYGDYQGRHMATCQVNGAFEILFSTARIEVYWGYIGIMEKKMETTI